MLTYVLMSLLVLALGATTLWGVKYDPKKNSFMSIEDTTFLRGFWCIIVVLVHIPAAYQNRIQEMLGSFAYIGVTFFFMTSAYGLKWNLEHKEGYMNHFWQRRLPPILIPALVANAIAILIRTVNGETVNLLSFININDWVKVLLFYYVVFWIIYGILPKFMRGGGDWQDVVLCLIVVVCSLIDRLTDIKVTSIWIVEPLGFAYGIIVAKYRNQIREWLNERWLAKCTCLMIVSGVLGIAYLRFKPVVFWGDYGLKVFLGIAITMLIYILIERFKVGNRVNRFLGSISYEVYLLHGSAFSIAIMLGISNSGIFVCSAIIITILLSACLKVLGKGLFGKR